MVEESTKFDKWLKEQGGDLLVDSCDGGQGHLDDEVIAAVVDGEATLEPEHLAHLASCSECRSVLTVQLELPVEQDRTPGDNVFPLRRLLSVVAPLAAIAAGVVLFLWPGQPGDIADNPKGYTARGDKPQESAEVVLMAVGHGGQRDLSNGADIGLNERLAFRYGQPQGEFSSLTIVGWDGDSLHWYYPEAPDKPAYAIKSGDQIRSVRLPFDILLSEKHRVGKLTIAIGFDVRPHELGQNLSTEMLSELPEIKLLQLNVVKELQ